MVTVGVPWSDRGEGSLLVEVGCITRIGTGEFMSTIAAVAVAVTVVNVGPKSRIRVVLTSRDTVTFTRLVGYAPDSETPGAEVGKSTLTVSIAEPPNPSRLAYLHGVLASVVEQVKELVENLAGFVLTVFVPSKMLSIAACADASAASCAFCS